MKIANAFCLHFKFALSGQDSSPESPTIAYRQPVYTTTIATKVMISYLYGERDDRKRCMPDTGDK